MPWLKEILKAQAAPPPNTGLKTHAIALSGHILYKDPEGQYWMRDPLARSSVIVPWTRADGKGARQAPVGHWVEA